MSCLGGSRQSSQLPQQQQQPAMSATTPPTIIPTTNNQQTQRTFRFINLSESHPLLIRHFTIVLGNTTHQQRCVFNHCLHHRLNHHWHQPPLQAILSPSLYRSFAASFNRFLQILFHSVCYTIVKRKEQEVFKDEDKKAKTDSGKQDQLISGREKVLDLILRKPSCLQSNKMASISYHPLTHPI